MLSPEQIAARKGRMTASRIACLMTADTTKIMQLYMELTDDPGFIADDLRDVWPVRLGEATEQLSLDWFQEKNGLAVTRRGEVVVHPEIEWAAATLDGWVEEQ
jgi:hypothetical protein